MSTPGRATVLLDSPRWQVFAQSWPVTDGSERWSWGVASRQWPGLLLEGIESGLAYALTAHGGQTWFTGLPARSARLTRVAADTVRVTWPPNAHGLALTWEARLTPEGPLLWQLRVRNQGTRPVWLVRWTLLRAGPPRRLRRGVFGRIAGAVERFSQRTHAPEIAPPGALRLHDAPGALAFYAHAWASWGHSRVYFDQPARPQARFFLDRLLPPRHDPAAPKPRGPQHFYSDLFGIVADRTHRRGLLLGFAGQRQFFGGVEVILRRLDPYVHMQALGDRVLLEPSDVAWTDWAVLWAFDLDDPDGMTPYWRVVADLLTLQPRTTPPTGWLSWYEYFRTVTAAHVRANASAARDLAEHGVRLQVMQVDDGYAAVPGLWEPPSREGFGSSLAALAADLRARGFRPGIWQAPFIAHRAAAWRLRALLRWRGWRPAFAGWIWNTLTFGLDPSHPATKARAQQMAREAAQQGFRYLKLDFLYAGALPGRRADPKRSRAAALYQALYEMVQTFRIESGSEPTHVLLCGVPLGTALGWADTVRIGPDVDPRWCMAHPLPWVRRHPDTPGLRNALRGVLMRAFLHGHWWLNDPDPLLPTSPHLTPAEQETWHTVVALTGGAWFVSADLTRLTDEALARLQRVFPPLQPQRVWVPDLWDVYPPRRLRTDLEGPTGTWHLLAVLNWADKPVTEQVRLADFGLTTARAYWVRPFWRGDAPFQIAADAPWSVVLPRHGVGVWAVRAVQPAAQYVGDDLHIGQGAGVTAWQATAHQVRLTLALPGPRQGRVWLALPTRPRQVWVNRTATVWHEGPTAGLYAIPVAFRDQAEIVVEGASQEGV